MCFPCAIVIHQVPCLMCKSKSMPKYPPFTKPPFVNSRTTALSACRPTCLRACMLYYHYHYHYPYPYPYYYHYE